MTDQHGHELYDRQQDEIDRLKKDFEDWKDNLDEGCDLDDHRFGRIHERLKNVDYLIEKFVK